MRSWLFGRPPARDVVLFTRRGCHLCDDARALLERAARRYGLELTIRDVDEDATLAAEHGSWVPVVQIDGKVRFRGVVNEALLVRVLRRPEAQ